MSVRKRRFSVTLTPPYIRRLDTLVEAGFFLDHQEVIRIALRQLFANQGIPLKIEEVEA